MRKIYKTHEAERQYKRIFKETAKRFGKRVALQTLMQLKEVEERLASDQVYGRFDPEYYSERFEFVTIKNSQTIIFERIDNDIIIVAAGWSGRNWKERLEEMQPYIDRQLNKLKRLKHSDR